MGYRYVEHFDIIEIVMVGLEAIRESTNDNLSHIGVRLNYLLLCVDNFGRLETINYIFYMNSGGGPLRHKWVRPTLLKKIKLFYRRNY